jgi:DNA-directed RNA polymerase specialized sigma24 family protein/anti-sigma factor RsiW
MESGPLVQKPGDAKLLDMVWAGDTEAFGVLYERHVAAAWRLARLLTRSPAEADVVVAEAFAQVLDAARRGTGVSGVVRPYVLTVVRQICDERLRSRLPAELQQTLDPRQPFSKSELADLENTTIARAYFSLPDSWRAVLWHSGVEQAADADIAPLLGVSGRGVASLRRSAVEGLRKAYLEMHSQGSTHPECAAVAERLGSFVSDNLPAGEAARVSDHLAGCDDCGAAYEELAEVDAALRGVVAPLVLGSVAARYLEDAGYGLASEPAADPAGTRQAVPAADGTETGWYLAAADGPDALPDPAQLSAATVDGEASATHARRMPLPGDTEPPAGAPDPRRRLRPRSSRMLAAAAGLAAGVIAVVLAAMFAAPHSTTGHADSLLPAPSQSAGGKAPTAPPSAHSSTRPPSAAPSRGSSPSQSPSPSVAPGPSPSAPTSPAPPVPGTARLTASISPGQSSMPFEPAYLTFQIGNAGSVATGALTASITFPGDVEVVPDGPTSGGWACQPSGTNGATCTHSPLSPGQSPEGTVEYTPTCGQFSVVVTSGSLSATAEQNETC